MKNAQEFMERLSSYFSGIKNRMVAEYILEELKYVRPGDYDRLFRQMAITQPASWMPDLKSITEAIKALKLDLLSEQHNTRICPVPQCRTENNSTGICPVCCYRPDKDGTPEEHGAWWTRWKAGDEPHFSISSILNNLEKKKIIR